MKFLFSAILLTAVGLATTSCGVCIGDYCFEDEDKEKEDLEKDFKICYQQDKIDACIKEQESHATTNGSEIKKICQEKFSYTCKEGPSN